MIWRSRLTGTRDKPQSPRSTEVINPEINQSRSPKPRLTSRSGALTWKATILTLDKEHLEFFPDQLRNWSNNLDQHKVTASSQPSWLKLRPPSPTQRCLPSLIGHQAPKNRWRDDLPKKEYRWGHLSKSEEVGCLRIRHAQDIQSNCGPNKRTTLREGGIGRHFTGGQDWPIPDRLPDDPEEDLLLKPIGTTSNPLVVNLYESTV